MMYSLKPPGREKNTKKLQHCRRVTYDHLGSPVIRLQERRDVFGKDDRINPLEKYSKTK